MNCTKSLPAFGGHPMVSQSSVTPVDMAMRLSLCHSQPLCHLMGVTTLKSLYPHSQPRDIQPHRPSFRLTPRSPPSSGPPSLERTPAKSCLRREDGSPKKRRVVFADALGLSLTLVRVFITEPTSPTTSPCGSPCVSPAAEPLSGLQARTPPGPRYRLRLAFPQPNQDFKAFHGRLQETGVQLESCSVSETSLSGTVRVCNAGFEKSALVRVTFDSWRSCKEVPCSSSVQRYAGLDADLFVFSVAVPQNLDPKERVEFCVSCRSGCGSPPLWDDNRGQNYRLIVEPEGSGNPTFSGNHPASSGNHLASSGIHPASSGIHPASSGIHPASSGIHPASSGIHPASWSLSRTPCRTLQRPPMWSRMGTLAPKNCANVFPHQNWRAERLSQI